MNPRLAFVIFWILYFSVLLVSFLLALFYPFFTPYGWFVAPLVANFWVGYLVREVDTAVKIIIVSFFLHSGIVIGLLNVSLVYDAFLSFHKAFQLRVRLDFYPSDPFSAMVIIVVGYPIMHIVLGIAVSVVGTTVRDYIEP